MRTRGRVLSVPLGAAMAVALAGCPEGKQDTGVVGGCRTSDDCGAGQVCNPCALRCIADPGSVADGEFAATFEIFQEDGADSTEQNTLGVVGWAGETVPLCLGVASVDAGGVSVALFTSSEQEGANDVLRVSLLQDPSTIALNQDIQIVDRYISEERGIGNVGYWERFFFDQQALASRNRGSDVFAVIDQGTVRFDALATDGNGPIRGTMRGRLRTAGPLEQQVFGGGCYDDQGLETFATFVDPRTSDDVCVAPFADHTLLAALTCRYHDEPANRRLIDGLGSLTVRTDADELVLGSVLCSSGFDSGVINVTAVGQNGSANPADYFVLNADIDAAAVVPGATIDLGAGAAATLSDGVLEVLPSQVEAIRVVGAPRTLSGQIGIVDVRREEARGFVRLWLSCGDGTLSSCFTASDALTRIEIEPPSLIVPLGQVEALQLVGVAQDGSRRPITSGIEWSASNPEVANVSRTGVVLARAIGSSVITARAEGFTATTEVTVFDPAQGVPLPMVVDVSFPGRSAFGDGPNGTPLHAEDGECPTRPQGAVGVCHRQRWNGMGGTFTGAVWTVGSGFVDLESKRIAAGATEVSFVAWGANGGEVIEFGAGIVNEEAGWNDGRDRTLITLTTVPTEYTVELVNLANYSNIYGAFIWTANNTANPNGVQFFIDSIQWRAGQVDPPLTLPMVVDTNYPDRSAFGRDGPPLHTEDGECPQRAGGAAGNCHRFVWNGTGGFTGTFWTIGTAFMNLEGRRVQAGATAVSFWAWGAQGGEVVEFGGGIADPNSPGRWDGAEDRLTITLSRTPRRYTVLLDNLANYARVYAPFIWVANDTLNEGGATFYVDDIQWRR